MLADANAVCRINAKPSGLKLLTLTEKKIVKRVFGCSRSESVLISVPFEPKDTRVFFDQRSAMRGGHPIVLHRLKSAAGDSERIIRRNLLLASRHIERSFLRATLPLSPTADISNFVTYPLRAGGAHVAVSEMCAVWGPTLTITDPANCAASAPPAN